MSQHDVGPEALVYEVDVEAPPEKVWRALATPELREAWLGRPDDGEARVIRAEPGERLDLAWPSREGESLISLEIRPADAGARLVITHRAPRMATILAFEPRARRAFAACAWRAAA